MRSIFYLLAGAVFGFILMKSEAVSWFRIQEMFRFRSFHMYGILLSAIGTGMLSVWLIRRFRWRTFHGEAVVSESRKPHVENVIGGLIFGLGWAMTGACPGPLYALTGSGLYALSVSLIFALAGTFVYGLLRDRLPH